MGFLKGLLWGNYGGDENRYFTNWARKKNFTIFLRSHTSFLLAATLVLLSGLRELVDIFGHQVVESTPWLLWGWRFFLFVLFILTAYEAYWEWRGDKLDVSEQEKRFAIGMRELLSVVDKVKRDIDNAETIEEIDNLLEGFISKFLRTASNVLCGNNTVHAGLMLHNPEANTLELLQFTDKSGYIPFTINLGEANRDKIGPAQMAFIKNLLAHMPKKEKRIGWLFREDDAEKYSFEEFIRGWFEVPEADKNFDSVLSVPISSYAEPGREAVHGVLNFTTAKKDYFIPRDYIMAFCFASIVAQAKDAATARIEVIMQ